MPPTKKLGILIPKLSGSDPAKILSKRWSITTTEDNRSAYIDLIPIRASPLDANIAMKNRSESIKSEPEVPKSKTTPATDFDIAPEKKEDIRAKSGNRATGIRNFDLGKDIFPVERVFPKNAPRNTTIIVAKKATLTEYKDKKKLGINIRGVKKTNNKRQYSKIFPKSNFECI